MKKIKIIALIIMLAFLVTIPGIINADETLVTPNKLVVFKISDYNYYTQDIGSDKVTKVKMDVTPLIKNNRTFVPVRFLGNALGVSDSNIQWDNATRTATLKGKAELKLKDGEKTVTTNGNKQTIDVAPYIIPPGRTMLPARYVAEGLGFTVEWDKANQLAICYPAGTQKPDMKAVLQEINKEKPKEGLRVIHDPQLETMYHWFESRGYKVALAPWTGVVNDYGCIRVYGNKNDSNKEQFDKDVYNQIAAWLGKEGAEWVKVRLDWTERPNTAVLNDVKVFGDKDIAVVMERNGDIFVEFNGDRYY